MSQERSGLEAQHDMLFGENPISLKNLYPRTGEMGIIQRAIEERVPNWTCSDCGTFYFCVGTMRFCPACKAEKDKLEQKYWDNKRAGLASIATDIVAGILNK